MTICCTLLCTSIYVHVAYVSEFQLFSLCNFVFLLLRRKQGMKERSRHPAWGLRHITAAITWLFFSPSCFIQMGCVRVNSETDKKIKKKKKRNGWGTVPGSWFLPLLYAGFQASMGTKLQTLLMHNIYHRGSSACHPGLITPSPPVINHSTRGMLSQEQPGIRSAPWRMPWLALAQFLWHTVGQFLIPAAE